MLIVLDPDRAAAAVAAGTIACPTRCGAQLGPWGHARWRQVRVGVGVTEAYRPRRARCRGCGRTQVLVWARTFPHRCDTAETVGAALVAAAEGLGFRRVAEHVERPATTVRGWLRRARTNSEVVRSDATVALHALDPNAERITPAGSALGEMLEVVGLATAAAVRRLAPMPPPWQVATAITAAGILASRPTRRWHRIG